jgi:hypothetical protein
MTDPWYGSQPPDAPVTVTMPYQVAKRVLRAVVRDGWRIVVRGDDRSGPKQLAVASALLGDAIEAPPNRRFVMPRLQHAVLAGSAEEYGRWLATADLSECPDPVYVADAEAARHYCYSGHTTVGAWEGRSDAKELLSIVRNRTFER